MSLSNELNSKQSKMETSMITDRELLPFYIGASEEEQKQMLESLDLSNLDQLFKHIPPEVFLDTKSQALERLNREELKSFFETSAEKNKAMHAFIGDGLPHYELSTIIERICAIRGLTTAYTPYQPERSQGTLISLWIYQTALTQLTGFEAINASLYDRSTAMFEAITMATRVKRNQRVFIAESLLPSDREVIHTLAAHTSLEIHTLPIDPETGRIKTAWLENQDLKNNPAAILFPQVNSLGLLEDVHEITNIAHRLGALAIASIQPELLSNDGLIPPAQFGENGADIIIGDAHALCYGPNFGGPGLGFLGIRFNEKQKQMIRQAPGRFIGKTIDSKGKQALSIILSTREQHIRREKATSNICSNQSFMATLAGSNILEIGSEGIAKAISSAHKTAYHLAYELLKSEGVNLAFNDSSFFNEFVLALPAEIDQIKLMQAFHSAGIEPGLFVNGRVKYPEQKVLLKVFCNNIFKTDTIEKYLEVFRRFFPLSADKKLNELKLPTVFARQDKIHIPAYGADKVVNYYEQLGDLNISPDDAPYPLGSCTMKYNPKINEYAAGLKGFTQSHPQSAEQFAQGSLKVLFEVQESFKHITGLPAVTTQPVAGAQGELVGLKMFQAYHQDVHPNEKRDVILIPRSAHGTNPATATMAGFLNQKDGDLDIGIVHLEASESGEIDFQQFESCVEKYGQRIAGIMITNPNTCGIFETQFAQISERIHQLGGLVYMDGANMNAIAGWIDLDKLGVDAVHNNLHKTWTIPHGGGGPGDAIVAVSHRLADYLPGHQIRLVDGQYQTFKTPKSIGSFHRHFGNFAHKVRCLTYLKALGSEGIRKMSANAVLSARYLQSLLEPHFPILPSKSERTLRMHEFILTLPEETFNKITEVTGMSKNQAVTSFGKLFLDFGHHPPTVAFPEALGLMVEPTETYNRFEIERFAGFVKNMGKLVFEHPEVLKTVPHFTPVYKIDEVQANRKIEFGTQLETLPEIYPDIIAPEELREMSYEQIKEKILQAHKELLDTIH
jgi:glycine dehydrogenase